MYTVEFERDSAVITSLDDDGKFDDIEVIIGDNGGVFFRQFDPDLNQYSVIYISYKQFLELTLALQSTEGSFRLEVR